MIIDNLNVFSDNVAVASGDSSPVNVMPFLGRGEPVSVTVCLAGDISGLTKLTVKLQQADSAAEAFADTGAGLTLTTEDLKTCRAFRFELPDNVTKPALRLSYTATGSGGTIFAAMTRDVRLPWAKGQMIDSGRVVA